MARKSTHSPAPIALADEDLTAASGAGLALGHLLHGPKASAPASSPVYAGASNYTSQTNTGVQIIFAPGARGDITAVMGQSNSSISANG